MDGVKYIFDDGSWLLLRMSGTSLWCGAMRRLTHELIWRCYLKPAVNSSLTKFHYGQVATVRAAWWVLKVPNFVWLAMIVIAATALSLNTIAREREEFRRAHAALAQAQGQVTQAQTANRRLKDGINNLKNDPHAVECAAQERLNYLRSNEIAVAVH